MKTTKQKEKEREGRGGGEEDRMKNKKEKERKKRWDQVYLDKRKYSVGIELSALVYIIGILVTSTTISFGGSVVTALASQFASQAKGRGFDSASCSTSCFFPTSIFLSYLSKLCLPNN